MRVYIESTIPGYLVARRAPTVLLAARQQITRDWWEFRRPLHELFTTELVLDEVSRGEPSKAEERLAILDGIPVLRSTMDGESLTEVILQSGLLPAHAVADAAHIALASVHKMDILLTWNCRHIANAAIQLRLRKLVLAAGHVLPVVSTPETFLT